MNDVSLVVRAFLVDSNPDAEEDRELNVDSVEIDDGTLWVYIKDEVKK